MDERVVASMARWPDLPAVRGWMSLSEQGLWRLHPAGDAWQADRPGHHPLSPGEPIQNAQLRRFIDRNYACDGAGRWFFQNGPQRVYVRLDVAPFILRTGDTPSALLTHNGLEVERIDGWWLDDRGRLYAQTDRGPGLISGRDAPSVFEALHTSEGRPLLSLLETFDALQTADPIADVSFADRSAPYAPFRCCPGADLANQLGFVRYP